MLHIHVNAFACSSCSANCLLGMIELTIVCLLLSDKATLLQTNKLCSEDENTHLPKHPSHGRKVLESTNPSKRAESTTPRKTISLLTRQKIFYKHFRIANACCPPPGYEFIHMQTKIHIPK